MHYLYSSIFLWMLFTPNNRFVLWLLHFRNLRSPPPRNCFSRFYVTISRDFWYYDYKSNFPPSHFFPSIWLLFIVIVIRTGTMSNSFSAEDVRDLLSKISKLEEVAVTLANYCVELSLKANGIRNRNRKAQENTSGYGKVYY